MPISLLPIFLFVFGGMALVAVPTQSASAPPLGTAAPQAVAAVQQPVAEEPEPEVNGSLRRAAELLSAAGLHADALRIREMLRAKTALESPEARAERLLAKDVHDRGVRVEMIELAVDGYRALGWEEQAVALDWFAAVGRAQEAGGPTSVPPVPESANRRRGSIMDHMVELILGASATHHIQGHDRAADACMRLGRFYVERSLGAFKEPAPAGTLGQDSQGRSLSAIGYSGEDESPTVVPPAPKSAAENLSAAMDSLGAAASLHREAEAAVREREATKQALTQQIEALEAERDAALALRAKLKKQKALLESQRALLKEKQELLKKGADRSKSEGDG